jgi:hypothetical protein
MIFGDISYFLSQYFLKSLRLALAISSTTEYEESLLGEEPTHQYHLADSPHTLLVPEIISIDIDIPELATKYPEPSLELELYAVAIIASDVDDIFVHNPILGVSLQNSTFLFIFLYYYVDICSKSFSASQYFSHSYRVRVIAMRRSRSYEKRHKTIR